MVFPATLALALVTAGASLAWWGLGDGALSVAARVPGTDRSGADPGPSKVGDELRGERTIGPGAAGFVAEGSDAASEDWPQFRGPRRDNLGRDSTPLARNWPPGGPRVLWSLDVGEGYAGPVVSRGRVYLLDYDRQGQRDAMRCLSLADGSELWRFSYPVKVKRNHGMSRTAPAVADGFVVGIGPRCQVMCLDARTGEERWLIDLERRYGTTVPPWYAGQCPLIEEGRAILAPAGPEALMVALDGASGRELWRTPNPRGWKMTHSSIMPVSIDGRRMYVYCGSGGVVGVDALTGALLWETTQWKISIATVPSPVDLGDGRLFLAGGYNAGAMMLKIERTGDGYTARVLYRLEAETFGAAQQTPVHWRGHLYGVRPDGRLTCLDLEGRVLWTSGADRRFGLGPFLLAEPGLIYVLDDEAKLTLAEAGPQGYRELASHTVLAEAHDAWGPMALSGGRLLMRDLTRLVCVDVSATEP